MAVVQRLSDNAPEIGGGITGVGGTVALREFMDQNGPLIGQAGTTTGRLGLPSVLYGLGTGTLAGLGWWMTGRGTLNDFLLAHSVTAIPSGAVSAAMPVTSGTTAGAGARRRTRTRTRSRTRQRAVQDGGSSPSRQTSGSSARSVGSVKSLG